MSLDRLLFECTQHYRDRGFPESALLHLRWSLVTNTHDGQIDLQTAYPGCTRPVDQLLGHFKRCPPLPDQFEADAADAVFAFAFGYRMRQWTNGVPPTVQAEVTANRIPGANNAVMAEQCRQLHVTYKLALYVQFEIADAIGGGATVEYAGTRGDQGTGAVLQEFMIHAGQTGKNIRAAVVVAHRHHYDRCRIILEDEKIRVIPAPELYMGYDPMEAQPRVMSPEEYIVNDFASMAGMA